MTTKFKVGDKVFQKIAGIVECVDENGTHVIVKFDDKKTYWLPIKFLEKIPEVANG